MNSPLLEPDPTAGRGLGLELRPHHGQSSPTRFYCLKSGQIQWKIAPGNVCFANSRDSRGSVCISDTELKILLTEQCTYLIQYFCFIQLLGTIIQLMMQSYSRKLRYIVLLLLLLLLLFYTQGPQPPSPGFRNSVYWRLLSNKSSCYDRKTRKRFFFFSDLLLLKI